MLMMIHLFILLPIWNLTTHLYLELLLAFNFLHIMADLNKISRWRSIIPNEYQLWKFDFCMSHSQTPLRTFQFSSMTLSLLLLSAKVVLEISYQNGCNSASKKQKVLYSGLENYFPFQNYLIYVLNLSVLVCRSSIWVYSAFITFLFFWSGW